MNDLESRVSKKEIISKFADNTKLIHPVATNEDIDEMQADINHLQNWAEDWQMRYRADALWSHAFWISQPGTYISYGKR